MQKNGSGRSSIASAPKASRSARDARAPRVSATSGSVQSDSGRPRTNEATQRADHVLGRPARGQPGADDGTDAGAADGIEGVPGFGQRAQRAEVGQPTRAAAGQHDAATVAADQPRHARDVRVAADVVVAAARR